LWCSRERLKEFFDNKDNARFASLPAVESDLGDIMLSVHLHDILPPLAFRKMRIFCSVARRLPFMVWAVPKAAG
jgi:hypothetical protein